MRYRILVTAALSGIPILALPAQDLTRIHEGQRVRVTSSSNKDVTGVVSQARADSIVVFTEPAGATLGIATADLRKVDVSRGRSMGEGAKRGAMWGGALGVGLGVLGAALLAADDNTYVDEPSAGAFAAQMIGGGILWGAMIGGFVKAEKWDHASIQPRVGSKGVGLSIALR